MCKSSTVNIDNKIIVLRQLTQVDWHNDYVVLYLNIDMNY